MQKLMAVVIAVVGLAACSHDPVREQAERGDAAAQYALALQQRDGDEALHWLSLSATQGHPDAQNNLARRYELGEGVAQNYAKALELYTLSANSGCASAQYNIGGLYRSGRGVAQDYTKAIEWYKRAAQQGDVEAWNVLSLMYFEGLGVAPDLKEAYQWAALAAAANNREALKRRDRVAALLSNAELVEAQQSASALQELLHAAAR